MNFTVQLPRMIVSLDNKLLSLDLTAQPHANNLPKLSYIHRPTYTTVTQTCESVPMVYLPKYVLQKDSFGVIGTYL